MQTNSKSLDSVKRVTSNAPVQKRVNSFNFVQPEITVTHTHAIANTNVLSNTLTVHQSVPSFAPAAKKIFPYILTIVITFLISIATSQGIAKINSARETAQSGTPQIQNTTIPPRGDDLAVSKPTNPTLYEKVLPKPGFIHLASEDIDLPDPLEKRKEFLQEYLKARGSVLAEHVDAISEQSQWKLIIAISRAESQFCKRHALNNCWGIGGAWNLKSYDSYDQAVADVNRILEQKYISKGLTTPQTIVNKWVGHPSDNWEAAVQQELDNLKDVQ